MRARRLTAAGATVSSGNAAVGMVVVSQAPDGFLAAARNMSGVTGAAANGVIGHAPVNQPVTELAGIDYPDAPGNSGPNSAAVKKGKKGASDPLDGYLWDMDMMNVSAAHAITTGDKRVRVGVMDTGVDGTHPDLAANFDNALSRNFTTDMSEIDGDTCEYDGCVDPANADDNGHGTHVAGTMAAALNGFGMSGVAPSVDLVNVRAGQDCGVTLVGALGNNHEDLSNPRTDTSSPDYPGGTEHDRTINNANCWDLPVEGPHVIGVSSLGPSGTKADYSNYATDLTSGELELSAPVDGWFRDGFGTDTYRTNRFSGPPGKLILTPEPFRGKDEEPG